MMQTLLAFDLAQIDNRKSLPCCIRINKEGEKGCANRVKTISFRDLCPLKKGSRYSTHALHSYPAQLIPQIPYYFLHHFQKRNGDSTVMDPFCGAGTVAVEAMHNGWNSIGVDVNPVAALIAKVKTTSICKEILEDKFKFIVSLFNELDDCEVKSPKFDNIQYWFTKKNIETLKKIKFCINKIPDEDVADFYRVVFSSIIRSASKADPRICVPVLPTNNYKMDIPDAWILFRNKAKKSINDMIEFLKMVNIPKPSCDIYCKDITEFDMNHMDVDVIITSPPYICAQKYVRSTRLEAYWLGYNQNEQLETNKKTIGTERISKEYYSELHYTRQKNLDCLLEKIYKRDKVRAGLTSKYFTQMKGILEKLFSILSSNGQLVLVVGTNTVSGYTIETNKFLMKICKNIGFSIERIMMDKIISRGLMTKRNKTANIIDYEWVMEMRKS